jgi:hypothetical protein
MRGKIMCCGGKIGENMRARAMEGVSGKNVEIEEDSGGDEGEPRRECNR